RVLQFFYAEALFRDDRPANNLIVRGGHLLFPLLGGGLCFFFRRGFLGCRFRRRFLLRCRSRSNRFYVRRFDRRAVRIGGVRQTRRRILRDDQPFMLQHFVRLQAVWRNQRHAVEVAAGEREVAVFAVRNEQSRLRLQLVQRATQRLGLVRFE